LGEFDMATEFIEIAHTGSLTQRRIPAEIV
jgi:hypothetical protein